MAIVQTGSTLQLTIGTNANTGTVSTTITVPADAELIVVGVADYCNSFNSFYSTGSMTFTKGGVDTAMTSVATGGDTINNFSVAMFYMALPDTGSNKTLKWDWLGTGISTQDFGICSITFWKGVNTASPMRSGSAGIGTATPPYTTGTLTAQTGDLIVAFAGGYTGGNTVTSAGTWSNLTLLSDLTNLEMISGSNIYVDGAWATGSPSGNTTVAMSTATNWEDGGIIAMVIKPAAAAAPADPPRMQPKLWLKPWRFSHIMPTPAIPGLQSYTLTADPGAVTLAGVAATLTYAPHVGAIVQTGSNVDFPFYNSSTSGTITTTLTVPADADFAIVGMSAYSGGNNTHTTMTLTKGGADTAMTRVAGADLAVKWQTVCWYMVAPDTGTNKTLKWSWSGGEADNAHVVSITFWKGVNPTTPVRWTAGSQGLYGDASKPQFSGVQSVVNGDHVVGFCGFYYGPATGAGQVWEWTNLDEIAECSNQNYAEGAWASRAYVDKADIFAPVFTSQFTANDTGSSWRTQVTPYGDATQIRVTFAAGQSGGGWSTLHCSVGTWAGVNANTNATPVELKFGGASGFTIATGGTITSDWLTFSVTGGTRIVIITDQAPPYSVAAYNSSSTGADPPFGSEFWYKVTDTSWNVASPTGYTQVTNVAVGMRLIEGKGGSTIVAGVSSSSGSEGGLITLAMQPAAATGAYTLTATKGSITLSGPTTYLDANRILAAATGSIAVGGTATGLKYGRMLTATKGSIVLGGLTTGLTAARFVRAVVGPIVLAGTATGLKYGRMLTAAAGTIALTGLTTGLTAARFVRAVVGPIVLAGTATNLVYTSARKLIADLGTIVINGSNTSLNYGSGRTIVASTASIAVNGAATGLRVARMLAAVKGSIVLAGTATALRAARGLAAAAGAITVTGISTAVLRYARKLVATVGPIVLSGAAAGLRRAITLAAVKGSITLAGSAANLLYIVVKRIAAATGTITLFGPAAGLDANRVVTAIKGSIVLAGQAVLLLKGKSPFVAATGSITVAGQAANLVYRASYRMPATSASIRVAGREAGLSRSGTEQPGAMEFGRQAYLRRW